MIVIIPICRFVIFYPYLGRFGVSVVDSLVTLSDTVCFHSLFLEIVVLKFFSSYF